MGKERISRIYRIRDYRIFKDWNDESRPAPFKRVNLIYGANGSGKTTLSQLFYECSSADDVSPEAGIEILIEHEGASRKATELDSDLWPRVHVFSADYVRQNLRFDDGMGPNPAALLTLGKISVEAEHEIDLVKRRMDEVEPQIYPLQLTLNKAQAELGSRMSSVAAEIVNDLRTSSVTKYQMTNTYTKANVRAILLGDRTELDDASDDLSNDRAKAISAPMKKLEELSLTGLVDSDDVSVMESLLRETIGSQAIEALKSHVERSIWVQRGIPLHEDLSSCLFCGQVLTDARVLELNAHFDSALTTLQGKIDRTIEKLDWSVEQCRNLLTRLPEVAHVYVDLARDLETVRLNATAEIERYLGKIESCRESLRAKRENPFQIVKTRFELILDRQVIDDVNAVIRKHESERQLHTTIAAEAARRVEMARVATFAAEYDERAAEIEATQKSLNDLDAELAALKSRESALLSISRDPNPKAEELTHNVSRLLGRADLKFTIASDGMHYKIERFGEPARHLSEGEKTVIALLYFLGSVRKEVALEDEPIVVIDDPISSLDDSVLFGVSACLWAELVDSTFAGQVFLFTHNFELFRQWITSLERAGTKIKDGFTVHELRTRYREKSPETFFRWPQLEQWTVNTTLSKRLISNYHFLFAKVANTVIDSSKGVGLAHQLELLALAPNAARKLMEAFLSFRYPDLIGNFHESMRAACANVQDASIRMHVERYLHAYSHNLEADLLAPLQASEATVVLRSLFELIREVDPEHLTAMCKSVGINESELFAVPGTMTIDSASDSEIETL